MILETVLLLGGTAIGFSFGRVSRETAAQKQQSEFQSMLKLRLDRLEKHDEEQFLAIKKLYITAGYDP